MTPAASGVTTFRGAFLPNSAYNHYDSLCSDSRLLDWRTNLPEKVTLLKGDALKLVTSLPTEQFTLIITSPPYNIGKIYERKAHTSFEDYLAWYDSLIELLVARLQPRGSICWQVGSYIKNAELYPLDVYFYQMFKRYGMKLRNRIIWRFNFGHNSKERFSGRYETILWFTRSDHYKFNLDPVRIPQLYPGKRHSSKRGDRAGLPSGNPLGKNPSDYWEFSATDHFLDNPVWEIPNVKANHPEKTIHPCQFPVELVERCILALTDKGDTVLDPFVGTGTSAIAAIKNERNVIGIDKDAGFLRVARERLNRLEQGDLTLRPLGRTVLRPKSTQKVAQIPQEWMVN
jgi:DNA modification methylase